MKASFARWITMLLCSVLMASAVNAEENTTDPWQGFNRAMFNFNEGLDAYALKPVAKGYKVVMPDLAERGVTNFFANLGDVSNVFNNLLQGKVDNALLSAARLGFNTTFGLVGLIDVATPMGIQKQPEDFGQTLGYWGVDSGPYVVLPFFGPATVRDGLGRIPDSMIDPVMQVDDAGARNALYLTRVVDTRAGLLQVEKLISGDKYTFIRDAYLQKREYDITDGAENYDDSNF
ncbi:VacJ family lipoprotein [Pontibacter sp. JAM-7]|uniref:MlaA family lipoprotein n=1 Tax=Pontibacter sp. JAM-7 TaxID=3366581 RepID=UPI003AF441DE